MIENHNASSDNELYNAKYNVKFTIALRRHSPYTPLLGSRRAAPTLALHLYISNAAKSAVVSTLLGKVGSTAARIFCLVLKLLRDFTTRSATSSL